jgi:hypothetical protein
LFSDLYNATRNQLVEAKARGSRNEVRLAIGQLADYVRFVSPRPQRAILLETKPNRDVHDLLRSQDIAVIWRNDGGFSDDGEGRFT